MKAAGSKGFRTYKQALAENQDWKTAYLKELKKLEERGGLKVVPRQKYMKCLPFVEVLTEKTDNVTGEKILKVRLAARGDLERPENVYSLASGAEEMRMFIVLMKTLGAHVRQGDCPSAYLNGRLDKPVHLLLPEGHPKKSSKNDLVYECPASLYGLAVAGRVWYFKFVEVVEKFGLKPSLRSPCLFMVSKKGSTLYLQLYVDDFLFGSQDVKLVQECEDFLLKEFQVKSTQDVTKFVGMEIDRSEKGLFMHQQKMIVDLGVDYRIEKSPKSPMIANLVWNKDSTPLEDIKPLQKLFGELNYIAGLSRPDISYPVNRIARRLHDGTKEVYRSAKRILSYLVSTNDLALEVKPWRKDEWELKVYCDASFADVVEDKYKSTGGFIIYLNDSVVAWKTKKMKWICNSTAESEYLSLYFASKKAITLAFIVKEVFGKDVFPVKVMMDNQAVVQVMQRNAPGEFTKHMKTKYFSVQFWQEIGLINVEFVTSKENIADCFTKQPATGYDDFVKTVLKSRGSVVNRIPTLTNQVPRRINGDRGRASDRTDRIRDNVCRENLPEESRKIQNTNTAI